MENEAESFLPEHLQYDPDKVKITLSYTDEDGIVREIDFKGFITDDPITIEPNKEIISKM